MGEKEAFAFYKLCVYKAFSIISLLRTPLCGWTGERETLQRLRALKLYLNEEIKKK